MKISNISSYNFGLSYNQSKPASYINPKRLQDTFIRLAKVDTASCEDAWGENIPSSAKQLDFAHALALELSSIGLEEIKVDEFGILTAVLKTNLEGDVPTIALIAHMDTSPDAPSENINPIVHKYTSGDIKLKDGVVINSQELSRYQNQTIITSDGTTLLGADDKAGIAEILEALKVFLEHPELKRPTLKIAFTPDEEIGYGVEKFDVKKFAADAAYTIDGSSPDSIDTETFFAYNPKITIKGRNEHLGYAYKKLVNSISAANAIINRLPKDQTPETTKDREGYIHVDAIEGNVEKTTLKLVVRDFDDKKAQEKLELIKRAINEAQEEFPDAKIDFNPNKMYSNMKEKLQEFPQIVEFAKEGLRRSGYEPKETFVRGGTDGADLTAAGLLTPNLGDGSENYHTVREFVSLETMQKCCENIINTVIVWAQNAEDVMPEILRRRG